MKKIYLVLIAVMIMALPSVAQANLLSNSSFEDGTGEDADNWSRGGDAGRQNWVNQANTGDYFFAMYGWTPGSNGFCTQDVSQPTAANTEYTFSVYAYKEADFGAQAVDIKLEWFDNADQPTGDSAVNNIVDLLTGDYAQYSVTGTAPVGTTKIRTTIYGFNYTGETGARGAFFDDADLVANPVPEPTSLLLLGGGLAGLFSMVRRKK